MANSSLGGFHHIAAFGSLDLKIHPCCTADCRHVNLLPLGRGLVLLDELLWRWYFCCAMLPVFFFQQKNSVEIIVLVGIPSLTTIAAMGWGALELFSEEKFWRSKLSQAALAPPRDSCSHSGSCRSVPTAGFWGTSDHSWLFQHSSVRMLCLYWSSFGCNLARFPGMRRNESLPG